MDGLRQCTSPRQDGTCKENDPITRFVNSANEAIKKIAVPIATFAFWAGPPTLLFCLFLKRFRIDAAQMLRQEFGSRFNQEGLGKFLRVGATAALIRSGIEVYDTYDPKRNRKSLEESLHGILWSFLLGGLGGSLYSQFPALNLNSAFLKMISSKILPVVATYHYGILDLFGEFCQRQLVNIRERKIREGKGDRHGLAISATWLAGINTFGLLLVRPFKKSWGATFLSAGMILFFDTLLEAYVQREGGRESWRDLDTGRLVGANLWGYMGLFLPSVILANNPRSAGFVGAAVAVLELCLKNFLCVAPSLNNFNARLNGMNWNNAQLGHEVRHGTMMWLSQVGQVLFTPSSPIGIISDYTTSTGGSALVNERRPLYEGIPEIWREGFLKRIRLIGSARNETEKKAAFEELTRYLSHEMGRRALFLNQHLPSSLNLKEVRKILSDKENEEFAKLFGQYLSWLLAWGGRRTEQEEAIYQQFI